MPRAYVVTELGALSSATADFDVLGLGSVSIDVVLRVESWPAADTKVRVQSRECHLGGLTGRALEATAKLGGRCAYAGRLGTDEDSRIVAASLTAAGIDITHAAVDPAHGVVHSTIIASTAGATRNVFSNPAPATGAHDTLPSKNVIRSARVLLVDHHGIAGSIRAARIAREAHIPIVGDFERDDAPGFRELLDLVDHLILSVDFARRVTRTTNAEDAIAALWNTSREIVVLTAGANGCWSRERSMERPALHPAVSIEAIDTTGCGDVFHGAYALALSEGRPPCERLTLASGAAAFKACCQRLGTRAEVESLVHSAA
jgi:sugar/nucleoside kinase (ribokinase family)